MLTKIKEFFFGLFEPKIQKLIKKRKFKKLVYIQKGRYYGCHVENAIKKQRYEDVAPHLMSVLRSKKDYIRNRVKDPIVHFKQAAIPDLLKVLREEHDAGVKQWAALCATLIMEKLSDQADREKIADLLLEFKDDKAAGVRQQVSYGLNLVAGKKYKQAFLDGLTDASNTVKMNSAYSLIKVGIEALDALLPFLDHSDDEVRIKTTYVISEYLLEKQSLDTQQKILDAIHPKLKDTNAIVRENSVYIAYLIGSEGSLPHVFPLFKDEEKDVRGRVNQFLSKMGTGVADDMIGFVKNGTENEKRNASYVLSEIFKDEKDPPIIDKYLPVFHELLNDSFDTVRHNISYLLCKLGDIRNRELLERCLQDSYLWVQYNGLVGLANLYNQIQEKSEKEKYLSLFHEKYKSDIPELKMAAIEAFGKLTNEDDAVRDIILGSLYDENLGVRKKAISAVKTLRIEGKEEFLLDFINDDNEEVVKLAKKNLHDIGWQASKENIRKIKPGWGRTLHSWEEVAKKFIQRELPKNKPNFYTLRQQLQDFSPAYQHGAWIRVAQELHPEKDFFNIISCYIEALYCDPDPASVAWQWLSGQYNSRMNYLRSNDKFTKETATRLRKDFGFDRFEEQMKLYFELAKLTS